VRNYLVISFIVFLFGCAPAQVKKVLTIPGNIPSVAERIKCSWPEGCQLYTVKTQFTINAIQTGGQDGYVAIETSRGGGKFHGETLEVCYDFPCKIKENLKDGEFFIIRIRTERNTMEVWIN
jgi:hypothetical protein